jgi:apolipoprotein N-acyltransferase
MSSPQRTTHVALPRIGVRSIPAHLILVTASVVMLAFSFAPYGLSWLAYIALWPAGLLAARADSAARLTWTSFLVFWIGWLIMLAWVAPVTQGGYVVLCALMAAYWALALAAANLLHKRYRTAMVVLLPLAWVTSEYIRGRFLAGGLSWFTLGHTQASFLPDQSAGRIIQVADLFGELGVSLVVVMTSGLLVDLMTHPIMCPIGHNKHRLHRTIRGALILWLLVFAGSWFYGGYRIGQWEQAALPGPRIAVIQTNVPQDNKIRRTSEQDAKDWRRMIDLTYQAAGTSPTPDIIVWPETMVPRAINPEAIAFYRDHASYYSGSEIYHERIRETAQALGTHLIVGSPAYDAFVQETFSDGGVGPVPKPRYNSAFLYYTDGEQSLLRYDKMHRVPFGEFIPWVGAVPPIKALFLKWFTPYTRDYSLSRGESLTVFDIPLLSPSADQAGQEDLGNSIVRVVTPICYEDAVGRVVRDLVYQPDGTKRADMLVNLTNSAWYPGHHQQNQQIQIASIRCIETRVPMARSVNGGISGFIDSIGRVGPIVEVGGRTQWVDGYSIAEPRLDSRLTLYGRLGDLPAGCLAAFTVFLLLWGKISTGNVRH